MKRSFLLAAAVLVSGPALAIGNFADVSVTDRTTGESLTPHYYRGEYWIAGRPGARYAIAIRNLQGRRLLAVASVDGVNVVTGETASSDQRGYVFDPWVGYDIAGWRKSNAEVAAFEFTSVPKSYAARTGRSQNVGVIGVALFREREPLPLQSLEQVVPVAPPAAATKGRADGAANEARDAAAPYASASAESLARPAPQERAQSLGTGHGRRESSLVTQVDFVREQPAPNEVIRIRYDSRENLVAMGIIPPSPPRRHVPQPFPGEPALGYVPDP